MVASADRGESALGALPLEAFLRVEKHPGGTRLTGKNIVGRLPANVLRNDRTSGSGHSVQAAERRGAAGGETEIVLIGAHHDHLGARAFLQSGLLEPRRITAMVNFDMVGRNPEEPVRLYHNGRGAFSDFPFHRILQSMAIDAKVVSEDPVPSDQKVFHQAGVPTLLFFTGLHDDYHGLDDESDRIDSLRHQQSTELAIAVVRELVSPEVR